MIAELWYGGVPGGIHFLQGKRSIRFLEQFFFKAAKQLIHLNP